MATATELINFEEDADLCNRVYRAMLKVADAFRADPQATAPQLAWARGVFNTGKAGAKPMLRALLAQYADAAPTAIVEATDEQVQTAIANAIDLMTE